MRASQEQIKSAFNQIRDNGGWDLLENLLYRWMDEKGFEKTPEYTEAFKLNMPYLNILCATTKPFGFKFKVEDTLFHVAYYKSGNSYKLKINGK